jgi:hypothetical protein
MNCDTIRETMVQRELSVAANNWIAMNDTMEQVLHKLVAAQLLEKSSAFYEA